MACNSAVKPGMDVSLNEKSAAPQARKLSPELLSVKLIFLSHGLQRQQDSSHS